jgi:vacuolar iron transporter family protein
MQKSLLKGLGFGLTSGIITTLGLIVGLNSGTHMRSVVLSGILVIAVADALSDSLGMHVSEESSNKSLLQVWKSTFMTLLSKFVFAITFMIPFLFLQLNTAVIVSIIWGLSLITIYSYYIAKKQNENPYQVMFEHFSFTIIVIVLTHYIGILAEFLF